jgi:DNA-binding transcriptional MerR regulator
VEYGVDELSTESGLSVDTIRYYQSFGILPGPERRGRNAVYRQSHLDRLVLIRSMSSRGFSLKAIRELLVGRGTGGPDQALLAAIEEGSPGEECSSEEFARRLGIPRALLRSVERTGLAEPQLGEDGRRGYSETDLGVARGALKLLGYGMPLTELLSLAVNHDRAIRKTVDKAIDLFDDYIRKREDRSGADAESVAEAYRELLPVVTGLVAHHFQRILVNRALTRLRKSGERGELEVALKTTSRSRLGLRWR